MASARDGCAPVSLELRSVRMRAKVAPSASPRLRGRPERVPSHPPGQTRAHAEQSGGHPRRKADGARRSCVSAQLDAEPGRRGCHGGGQPRVPHGTALPTSTSTALLSPPHTRNSCIWIRGGGGENKKAEILTERSRQQRRGCPTTGILPAQDNNKMGRSWQCHRMSAINT